MDKLIKILFTVLILSTVNNCYSQGIITIPVAETTGKIINSQAKSDLTSAAATTANMSKTLATTLGVFKELQKAADKINKINSVILKSKQLKELFDLQVSIVEEYGKSELIFSGKQASIYFTPREIEKIEREYKNMLNKSMESIDLVQTVFTKDKSKMGDFGRIELLMDLMEKQRSLLWSFQRLNRSVKNYMVVRKNKDDNLKFEAKLY